MKFQIISIVIFENIRQLSVRQFYYKLILFSIICCFCLAGCTRSTTSNFDASTKLKTSLVKCIDGDTAWFTLNDVNEKVRFLAIDSPELNNGDPEPFALDASKFTCNLLENANTIYLELDPLSTERDKYNRLLAWVWVDNTLLNSELVKAGYAVTKYMFDDYLYNNLLIDSELIAKDNNLGVWSND